MPETLDCKDRCVIVLPSLNPNEKFDRVVDGLREAGFRKIVIVDDGSDAEHQDHFSRAEAFPECTLVRHAVNKGKGRALKDGFIEVMRKIADEAANDPELVKSAPHNTPIGRVDDVLAAKNPVLTWKQMKLKQTE